MDIDLTIDLPTILVMVALSVWLWRMLGRSEDKLKGEIAGLKKDLEGDIEGVKKDLEGDIEGLRTDVKSVEAVVRETDRELAHLAGRLDPYSPPPSKTALTPVPVKPKRKEA